MRKVQEELNNLINFGHNPESKKASDIIAYLNQKTLNLKLNEDKKVAEEIYTSDTTSIMYLYWLSPTGL